MKDSCGRCGRKIKIRIRDQIKNIFSHEKVECEQCKKIASYEKQLTHNKKIGTLSERYCEIGSFKSDYYVWLEKNIGKRCVVRDTAGMFSVSMIVSINAGQVEFYSEETEYNYSLPIYEIDKIEILDENVKKYNKVDDSFMIGYKGLLLEDGILGDGRFIYEIGIPYKEEYRDPFMTDYQDVYSHYCESIEDVLVWRDYISSPLSNVEGHHYGEFRLFRVKAEGHYFQNTECGWVTNCLTVLGEVSQAEIIEYFEKNEDRKRILKSRLQYQQAKDDAWDRYRKNCIGYYRNNLSDDEALQLCVEGSPLYGVVNECNAREDIFACSSCIKRKYCFEKFDKYTHYCYLFIRNKIRKGLNYKETSEYLFLVENNNNRELQAIMRLDKFYKEKGNTTVEFFSFRDEKEFQKSLEYYRVDKCDSCDGINELVECEAAVFIGNIQLVFPETLILKCKKCGKIFMPDHFAKAVIYKYQESIKGGCRGGTFPRATSYTEKYSFCQSAEFAYDYRDYRNIPGLCHDEEHADGFLTPVYFEKSALIYFITSPEYEVNIFSESYGDIRKMTSTSELLWVIPFGFNSNGKLIFWLGDLAELDDITLKILKGFNIESDHILIDSEFYQAQMNCVFSEPITETLIVINKNKFIRNTFEKEKIHLEHLPVECEMFSKKLCRPVIYTQDTVSEQINLLDKILVEGISVSGLRQYYELLYTPERRNENYKEKWQSIKLMEEIIKAKCPQFVSVRDIMTPIYLLHDYRILADHLLSGNSVEEYKEHIVSCLGVEDFNKQEEIYLKLIAGLNKLFQLLSVI